MDEKLKRIQELKKQKFQISDEIAKLGEEIAAEMKTILSSGSQRKPRTKKAANG